MAEQTGMTRVMSTDDARHSAVPRGLAQVHDTLALLRQMAFAASLPFRTTSKPLVRDLLPSYTPPHMTQLPAGELSVLTQEFPVLHADDDEDVCRLVRLILQRGGLHVISVLSGEDALTVCEHVPVSLLVTDIMKPKMDGFELVRRLHENPVTQPIPVVFLSARSRLTDQIKGYQLGAVDYLTKPVFPHELIASVRDALIHYGNWFAPPALDAALMRRLSSQNDTPHNMQ